MRLMRQIFHAKQPGEADWSELDLVYWEGTLGGARFDIYVEEAGAFPEIPPDSRLMLKRLGATVAAMRQEVAGRMHDLARDWAESGELPEPTPASLEAALRLDAIHTYEDWAPTLYFEECETDIDRMIFAGHVVEVRLTPDGSISEAHIAG